MNHDAIGDNPHSFTHSHADYAAKKHENNDWVNNSILIKANDN